MATDLRTDESHNISYPQSPDTRGTARIYHLRKPYYLGNHDSPLSYVMFGLWKHHLMEQGGAPPTAQIRERAEAFLGIVPTRRRRILSVGLMAFGLTLTTLIGALVGASFRSTRDSGFVDGIVLSENEMAFIRGVRKTTTKAATLIADANDNAGETIALAQGLGDRDEILKRIRNY
jgi:hypothetical protein